MPDRRCACPNCHGSYCHGVTPNASGVCSLCEDGFCKKEEEKPMPEKKVIQVTLGELPIGEIIVDLDKLSSTASAPQRLCQRCGKPEHGSIACEVTSRPIEATHTTLPVSLVPLGRVSIKREVGFTPIPQRKRREKKEP